jgi:hypothetical protein
MGYTPQYFQQKNGFHKPKFMKSVQSILFILIKILSILIIKPQYSPSAQAR